MDAEQRELLQDMKAALRRLERGLKSDDAEVVWAALKDMSLRHMVLSRRYADRRRKAQPRVTTKDRKRLAEVEKRSTQRVQRVREIEHELFGPRHRNKRR